MSLDQTVGAEDDAALGDFIEDSDSPAAEEIVSFDMMRNDVRRVVAGLDERERALVARRFGLNGEKPYTLEQIGKEFGMSRERVRQIERHAIAQLKGKTSTVKKTETVKVTKKAAKKAPVSKKGYGYKCPAGYPVKGNRTGSKKEWKYHVKGGAFYDRTKPEECFKNTSDARKAGYRASKR